MNSNLLRSAGYCLSAVLLAAAATSAGAWQNPLEKPHLTGPLDVCDTGSFFVGGVPKVTNFATSGASEGPPQQIIIGHMYVEYMVPKKRRQWPLILVHGGGYLGTSVSSTPHGTEGWYAYSVRNILATFVVDQAGRGRSSFDASVINEAKVTGDLNLIPSTGLGVANNGAFTSWFGHLIPGGSNIVTGTMIPHGHPDDPQCVGDPSHCTYEPQHAFAIDPSIEAREGAIGPAPNPANNTMLALLAYKYQVPNTDHWLPPSTCDSCTPTAVSGRNTWTPLALAELVEKLGGAIVATHSQSGIHGHHLARVLKERGSLHLLKGLITFEGSCSLTETGLVAEDFVANNVPYLAFKGDYSATSALCVNTVAAIQAAGGTADYIGLDSPEFGDRFLGTTHMAMMDKNNLDVFDFILEWAEENIPNPTVTPASCPKGPKPGKGPKN
jgi:hypothetical protein